jgi:hypothetical protein
MLEGWWILDVWKSGKIPRGVKGASEGFPKV